MKTLKIALAAFILVGLMVLSFGCDSASEEATAENQVVTVQRGNLTIDIAAAGNLALSRAEDLAFEIAGTVEEVLVGEGDTVEEGQALAKLDTSEWEEQLEALEDNVVTAEQQLTAKQRDLVQAEINLINAEIALQEAEAKYVWPAEVFAAREKVWAAELDVEEAQAMLEGGVVTEIYNRQTGETTVTIKIAKSAHDVEVWTDNLADAEEKLGTARVQLDTLLAESVADTKVAYAEEKLKTAQLELDRLLAQSAATAEDIAMQRLKVEQAQEQLEDVQKGQQDVTIKRLSLEQTEGKLEDTHQAIADAEEAIADAQEELDEAESKSPVITAPFDGFVTIVNVEGGDEVLKGTVAVQIADPDKFEAEILVSEMDILQVKLGGVAWVEVDAMSGMSLPATVTHISPTATIQSGVVNYKVKVEIQSLEEVTQEQQQARQEAMQQMQQGELPEPLQKAIDEGRITREEAEEMMERVQEGQEAQQGQVPTVMSEDYQLKEGLTVTVSIVVDERNDILLVPNSAITTQGRQTYVQVVAPDGSLEQRAIGTGITNWTYTEVTDGLSEDEQVAVPQGTAPTTATQQRRQGGMMIPGMGRPH